MLSTTTSLYLCRHQLFTLPALEVPLAVVLLMTALALVPVLSLALVPVRRGRG